MLITLFRDRLPKGLCFPVGLQTLSQSVPALAHMNGAVLFAWQSSWAAQIFDPMNGQEGRLAVMQCRGNLPRMRINAQKVRLAPVECKVIVVVFAVASQYRKRILRGLSDEGATFVSAHLGEAPVFSSKLFCYDLLSEHF